MTVRILIGDVRQRLRDLPDGSVHCVVTSPPYFGLRDYGHEGQIGLEPTPAEFVSVMVDVFREVRRVLRDDGTLWLNLGDSYATNGGPGWQGKNGTRSDRRFTGTRNTSRMKEQAKTAISGFKPKDMLGIPWRVAFALQADGWFLRQDIIWSKPNPMPESVMDRCTKSHEYLFLMSKSPRYYFDQPAILEPASPNTHPRVSQDVLAQAGSSRVPGKKNGTMKAVIRSPKTQANAAGSRNNESFAAGISGHVVSERNKRSVWTVMTQPFKDAHFATFPPALVEPCILAGSPKGGVVLDPFFGAGTTGLVCDRLGRDCIGIELNPTYAEMAVGRIRSDSSLFSEVVIG